MKYIFTAALIVVQIKLFCQTFVITYNSELNYNQLLSPEKINQFNIADRPYGMSRLILENSRGKSICYPDSLNKKRALEHGIRIQEFAKYIYYKDFKNNLVWKIDSFNIQKGGVRYNIKDYKWSNSNVDEKQILGYTCQLVEVTVNNTKFKVWYTTEIPLNDGPLNIAGAPGLIMRMEQGVNAYEVMDIKIIKDSKEIQIPENIERITESELRKNLHDQMRTDTK